MFQIYNTRTKQAVRVLWMFVRKAYNQLLLRRGTHFQEFTARPGPAHHCFERFGPARPGPSHGSKAHETRTLYMGGPDNYVSRPVDLTGRLMGRPMCFPVPEGACANANVIGFCAVFFLSGFPGTVVFGP